jgi:exosortase A-associated hydrolase 2
MSAPFILEPSFIEAGSRRLFVLRVRPGGETRGTVLFVPPFAEEMNRCRALVAEQARALAGIGLDCLLLDLYGTGDSEGDFAAVDWETWLDDVDRTAAWFAARTGHAPMLWGLRTGALLAAELAHLSPGRFPRLLLWQPVSDGKSFVSQLLRLRIASLIVHEQHSETTAQIRERLRAGEVLEIAGYEVNGRLAGAIEERRLSRFPGLAGSEILWIELLAEGDALPPGSRRVVDSLREQGCRVTEGVANGPPIWQLHVKDRAPALIERTLAMVGEVYGGA